MDHTKLSPEPELSIYKVFWSIFPSKPELRNKSVKFTSVDQDPENAEMAEKITLAYSNTWGKGIRPEAVTAMHDVLDLFIHHMEHPNGNGLDQLLAFAKKALDHAKL